MKTTTATPQNITAAAVVRALAQCLTLLTVERAEDFKPCRLGDIDDEDVKDYVARFTDDEE